MPNFDPEALRAAAESAKLKSDLGSNVTDQFAAHGDVVVDDNWALTPNAGRPLATTYMGLSLANPVVASAGPLSQDMDGIRALADGGVGAVVLFSLFEEQIRHEEARMIQQLEAISESCAEALDYFPTAASGDSGLTRNYLELIEQAKPKIDVPLIASLNGSSRGGWTKTAKRLQDAGADAIELNIYYVPGDLHTDPREVEDRHLEILADVKSAVSVPVAMKLSPFFSSFGWMALALDGAGADALVLFNRFLQPDIDLDRLEVTSGFDLSCTGEAKLPRNWIANLRGRVRASLAATTGVATPQDVVKYLLAGADVVMTTAALVRNGASYVGELVDGVESWLKRKELTLDAARGMLCVPDTANADAYAREGYLSGLERAKIIYAR